MNCAEIRGRMADYLYSELPVDSKSGIEDHLAACPACREELAVLRRARDLLDEAANRDEDASPAPLSLVQISDRAMRQLERNRRRWQWFSLVTGSALAALLLLYAFAVRIEFHSSHVIVSWNESERSTPASPNTNGPNRVQSQLVDHQLRLDDLDKTVHLLIQLTSADDRQRDREAMLFAKQLQSLRAQNDTRWRTIAYVMGQLHPSLDDQATFSPNAGEQP
jgi:putative zinc finger protein